MMWRGTNQPKTNQTDWWSEGGLRVPGAHGTKRLEIEEEEGGGKNGLKKINRILIKPLL